MKIFELFVLFLACVMLAIWGATFVSAVMMFWRLY